tara:strand:+ start:643 stop:1128 length:486 start_codon:yes stop_codon:yes gene_type:complete
LKKLLLLILLFTGAAFAVPESPDQLKKIEDEFRLACDEYGQESCLARLVAASGCTYIFSLNSGINIQKSLNVADSLFVAMMKGNRLKIETMFNESGNIKKVIKDESISRMKYCEKEIKTAMPIMLRKASGGKEPPEELIKYAANDFPYYWLRSLEDIRQGR